MKGLNEGWEVLFLVDDDKHLNIYIKNSNSNEIYDIETGQGDGINEQMAVRFTTQKIEHDHNNM